LSDARLRRLAVVPVSALESHRELWRALEEAYPVAFVARRGDEMGQVDAAVCFPGHSLPERLRVPCLLLERASAARARDPFSVEMSRSSDLDRTLRTQRLLEREAAVRRLQAAGVPVVRWAGPGSLDPVLRQIGARGGRPSAVRR